MPQQSDFPGSYRIHDESWVDIRPPKRTPDKQYHIKVHAKFFVIFKVKTAREMRDFLNNAHRRGYRVNSAAVRELDRRERQEQGDTSFEFRGEDLSRAVARERAELAKLLKLLDRAAQMSEPPIVRVGGTSTLPYASLSLTPRGDRPSFPPQHAMFHFRETTEAFVRRARAKGAVIHGRVPSGMHSITGHKSATKVFSMVPSGYRAKFLGPDMTATVNKGEGYLYHLLGVEYVEPTADDARRLLSRLGKMGYKVNAAMSIVNAQRKSGPSYQRCRKADAPAILSGFRGLSSHARVVANQLRDILRTINQMEQGGPAHRMALRQIEHAQRRAMAMSTYANLGRGDARQVWRTLQRSKDDLDSLDNQIRTAMVYAPITGALHRPASHVRTMWRILNTVDKVIRKGIREGTRSNRKARNAGKTRTMDIQSRGAGRWEVSTKVDEWLQQTYPWRDAHAALDFYNQSISRGFSPIGRLEAQRVARRTEYPRPVRSQDSKGVESRRTVDFHAPSPSGGTIYVAQQTWIGGKWTSDAQHALDKVEKLKRMGYRLTGHGQAALTCLKQEAGGKSSATKPPKLTREQFSKLKRQIAQERKKLKATERKWHRRPSGSDAYGFFRSPKGRALLDIDHRLDKLDRIEDYIDQHKPPPPGMLPTVTLTNREIAEIERRDKEYWAEAERRGIGHGSPGKPPRHVIPYRSKSAYMKPWGYVHRGGQWSVHRRGADGKLFGPSLGDHESQEAAQRQIAALHANVADAKQSAKATREQLIDRLLAALDTANMALGTSITRYSRNTHDPNASVSERNRLFHAKKMMRDARFDLANAWTVSQRIARRPELARGNIAAAIQYIKDALRKMNMASNQPEARTELGIPQRKAQLALSMAQAVARSPNLYKSSKSSYKRSRQRKHS